MKPSREVDIEIRYNKTLSYLKREIDDLRSTQHSIAKAITNIQDMLAEICHNCNNPVVERCYIERFEQP